jgi:hypothetical protein
MACMNRKLWKHLFSPSPFNLMTYVHARITKRRKESFFSYDFELWDDLYDLNPFPMLVLSFFFFSGFKCHVKYDSWAL